MCCGLIYSSNLNGQILLFPSTNEFVSQQDYKEAIHSLLLWYGSNLSGMLVSLPPLHLWHFLLPVLLMKISYLGRMTKKY